MYRPLPRELTINKSEIDGLGLFAVEEINSGIELGITHIKDSKWKDGLIRLPLGGFYNHSETPNIETFEVYNETYKTDVLMIRTIRKIKAGEELVAEYKTYNPTK